MSTVPAMRIAFRVDSSTRIASGHVERCLSVAAAFAARGHDVAFVCRELPGHSIDRVREAGFDVHVLPVVDESVDGSRLGEAWREDAVQTIQGLHGVDWLIVDHYELEARWEAAARAGCRRLCAIDDLPGRAHAADLVIDYNLSAPEREGWLCGPAYAPLRSEFGAVRARLPLPRRAGLRRVFVAFGGVDRPNVTARVVAALGALRAVAPTAAVVCGAGNPHRDEVRAACARCPGIDYYEQPARMAELMGDCDLAVGAGGTSSWERCCLGLPSLIVSLADNQLRIARDLETAGAARDLGHHAALDVAAVAAAIDDLAGRPEALAQMSLRAAALVDGRGAERIAAAMTAH